MWFEDVAALWDDVVGSKSELSFQPDVMCDGLSPPNAAHHPDSVANHALMAHSGTWANLSGRSGRPARPIWVLSSHLSVKSTPRVSLA
jgi:hypothetical protein